MSGKSNEELAAIAGRAAATWFNREEISAFAELLARKDEEIANLSRNLRI
jgi:hypothetical protein